ncbi:WD40-repeat-containing domain protein [Trichoderma sp. SZMC 28012]
MDAEVSHPPYDGPEEEMHNFISIISFLSEHFNQHLFCFPSSQEAGLCSGFSTAFDLLESVIKVHFSDGSNHATKGIGNAWYHLAQLIESWLLGDRGYVKPKTPIFKDLSRDDFINLTSRISAFRSVVEMRSSLLKLTNRYWNTLGMSDSINENRLLLITGEPGCGKTNLTLNIASSILQGRDNKTNDNIGAITYFFNHGNTIEDCISSVVRQLKQLAEEDTTFHRDFMIHTLCRTIEEMFQSIYVIIDGLDECCNLNDDGTAPRLENLLELIHWVVSCRSFDKKLVPQAIAYEELNLNAETAMQPSTKTDSIWDSSRKKEIEAALLEKSKGNRLWIKLACSILKRDPNNALDLVYILETQIEDLYARGFEQMKLTVQEEIFFKKIVTITIAAYQPLAISELRALVTMPDDVDLKQTISSQFNFFLEVREDIVYFSHQLSKEFLLKRYRDIGQVSREMHAHIALQCLKMLVRNNHQTNVSDNISGYCATSHWVKHLLRSQFASNEIHTKSISLDVALMDFLNTGFTRWLESMNKALHPLSRASRDLLQLRDYLLEYTDETNSLHDLIVNLLDAVRFHCFHDNVGLDNPVFSRSGDCTVRPKDSLLFYPYDGFKQQLLNKEFPTLLNVPATKYNFNDMALDIHFSWPPCCWTYSPDGRYLVIAVPSVFGWPPIVKVAVSIWDAYNGIQIGILEMDPLLEVDNIHDKFIRSIAFSASGELAILTTRGIIVWDFPSRTRIKTVIIDEAEKNGVRWNPTGLTFSPDGKELAAGSSTSCLAFSPKRQWLAAGFPSVIKIWDLASRKLLHTINGYLDATDCLSFSFDGTRLASASTSRPSTSRSQHCDRTISIWDLEGELSDPIILLTPTEYHAPTASEYVESVMFSPKDFSLAALMGRDRGDAEGEGTIRIWDTYALQHQVKNHLTQPDKHTNEISCLKFSHSGKFFATYDTGGEIRIWDGKTGKLRSSFQSGSGRLFFISPDDHIVTYSDYGVVAIWDTETDAETWSLRLEIREHTQMLSCAAFSRDGKRMATASYDGYMGIWNLPEPANAANASNTSNTSTYYFCELDENTKEPSSMAFSPDGTQLALATIGIHIWNLYDNANLFYPSGNVSFSQDAKFIIVSGNRCLGLWNIQSKRCIRVIRFADILFQSLTWDQQYPEYIFTELGPYFIGSAFNLKVHKDSKTPVIFHHSLISPPAQHLESDSYTLRLNESGVSWKGKLWVQFPERYRPFKKDSRFIASIHGKKIAMGYKSGHVTLLNFEGDDTEI